MNIIELLKGGSPFSIHKIEYDVISVTGITFSQFLRNTLSCIQYGRPNVFTEGDEMGGPDLGRV